MFFYRKYSLIGITIITILYFLLIKKYLFSSDNLIFLLCGFGVFYSLSFYKIKDEMVCKYYLFVRLKSICIQDIIMIEAVTVEQVGKAYIYIGKYSKHSGYFLCLKDGMKYKIHRDYTNNNWVELGIYLNKYFGIRIKEVSKTKLTNDWF